VSEVRGVGGLRDGGQVEGLVESVGLLGEKVEAVEAARQVHSTPA
jgi:hypothetical protein